MMRPGLVFLFVLGVVLAWVFLKDVAWTAYFNQGEAATAPPPTYQDPESWGHWPETAPEPVWEDGWAVDVFLVPPMPSAAHRHGIVAANHLRARRSVMEHAEPLAGALSAIGPVYMPLVRTPSPADREPDWDAPRGDLAAALETYLETRNAGRGLVIAVPAGSMALLDALPGPLAQSETGVSNRLGGLVSFSQDEPRPAPDGVCGQAGQALGCRLDIGVEASGGLGRLLFANLPGGSPDVELTDPEAARAALAQRRATLLDWLDANAARRAEPLTGFETIEVAPIRTPGAQDRAAELSEPRD